MRRWLWTWMLCAMVATAGARAQEAGALLAEAQQALAAGQVERAYAASYAAALALFQKRPFGVENTVLVAEEPSGYAMYTPRESNRYRPGETILVYLEPVGYRIEEGDVVRYGFAADLELYTGDGQFLGRVDNFLDTLFEARKPNLASFLLFSIDLDGVPAGEYVLQLRVRDLLDPDARVDVAVPIVMVE